MDFHVNLPAKFSASSMERSVKPIGILFLIIGLALFSYGVKVFLDGQNAQNWLPHTAEISKAGIRTHTDDDGDKSYSVEVAYFYEWEGKRYKGDQYRLHYNSGSGFEENNAIVKNLLSAKQDKRPYPIFVDPERPEHSAVLNVVDSETQIVSLAIGVIFSIIGGLALFRPSLFNGERKKPELKENLDAD